MSGQSTSKTAEYTNPVYANSFPDPFVLKFKGEYFAYCTGLHESGDVFTVLRSRDLVNWTAVGPAMKRLKTDSPFYWAPEVVHADGRFLLYYSVGNETLMELRVAESVRPDGGFVDARKTLTSAEFAIDAHVFTDQDGTRYLFYATDFLEHTHIGTGSVIDRMLDWFTLEGNPRPVTRAKYDWQVYDPHRKEKGGVRWYTVEGPTVLKRKGVYFEMFSGGNWQNTSYGVSFAVTDDLNSGEEWVQFSDGETVLPVLRTVPGIIVGPGHNSVVRGPNHFELYCVYHRWTDAGRVLAMDRMDIVHRRIFVLGATSTPQPAPFQPAATGFLNEWASTGGWSILAEKAVSDGPATLIRDVPSSFVCEFTVGCKADEQVAVRHIGGEFRFLVGEAELSGADGAFGLTPSTYVVRLEVDGRWIKVLIDEWHTAYAHWLDTRTERLCLGAATGEITFSGFSLTHGFEDLFDRGAPDIECSGWTAEGDGESVLMEGEMRITASDGSFIMTRSDSFTELDLAANIKSETANNENFGCGLLLRNLMGEEVLRLEGGAAFRLVVGDFTHEVPCPAGWDMTQYHQYRVMIRGGKAVIFLEADEVLSIPFAIRGLSPSVFVTSGTALVEMVRAVGI